MPRRAATRTTRWIPILAWTAGALIILLIAAILIGQTWLNRYLRSPEFRGLIEEKTGRNIRARVSVAPIRIEGTQFSVDTFEAKGAQDAAFSLVKVEDVRGDVSLPSIVAVLFGERKFRIPTLEVQRLSMEFFDSEKLNLDLLPKEDRDHRSVVENLNIRDVRLTWGGGGITGASIHGSPVEGGWQIEGHGGRILQLGIPPVDIAAARLVKKDRSIFIQEAKLRQNGGELTLSGEIATDDKADLLVNIAKLQISPLLPEDWRAKLHGFLNGEARIKIPLDNRGMSGTTVSGKVRIERGVIEALPMLNKIADYLRTDQFRRIQLNQASADVRYEGNSLVVENLVLECKQLLAIRGSFTYAKGEVNGSFEVGVTPGPLQWLPGSQEKVFNTQRDGYVWAPMRVTGTPSNLKEDLTGKLITAAQGAVVEKVEKTATEAVGTAVESAKKGADGVLNLLFGN